MTDDFAMTQPDQRTPLDAARTLLLHSESLGRRASEPVVGHEMTMSKARIIILFVLECISLVLIVHLWRRKPRPAVWYRCLWSLVLLVPLLGWILYGFVAINPETHSDELPEHWGSNAPPGS